MKKTLCFILVIILGVIMIGCKEDENTAKEVVTLKLGLPGGKNLTPYEILDSFKAANPNITIEIDETPWNEFKTKLKMQVAASNPPDIFIMDSGYVATLGGMGALVNLMELVKKDIKEDEYSKALFAGLDADGNLWGIPHGLNSVAIYYNKKLFDKAGIPYPGLDWTFDDMFEMAKKLTVDLDGDGAIDQYGLAYGNNITEGWLPFVLAAGGTPLDATRKKSMFKDEKTIEGVKKFILPKNMGITPRSEWVVSYGNSVSAFYMGKLGLMLAQSSTVRNINANAPEGFDYDVQIMPIGWDGNRHCVYVPNQWSVFSRTSEAKQKAAWEWIKHFISEESQMKIADTLFSGYPIKKSTLDYLNTKETVPANMKAFYEGIDEYGVTLFENKTFEEWRPKVDEQAIKIRKGEISLEAGIEEIDRLVTKALENE